MNEKNQPSHSRETATQTEKIALFRFGIIAPVLHDSGVKQTRYFKKMAQQVFDVPVYGRKKFNWKTFKSWLRKYRREGFEGLKPKTRADKGQSRIIDNYLDNIIRQKFDEFPSLKVAGLYHMLLDQGLIQANVPCEATLRKYIADQNLKPQAEPAKPRKKFEKPHVNDLWMSDFMHGQRFNIDGVKRKLFLCGIIDDHSRVLTGCRWTLQENTEALELVLKDALLTYGLPKMLYCDNGAVYASMHLQLVCARLGIALVHSKPYDSPSRGKIERFWRTVRQSFLPLVPIDQNYSLDGFNTLFSDWLDQQYHRRFHHGILQPPLDRYIADVEHTSVRRINQNELELHFYQTYQRKVNNDATVSINSNLFELPAKYIGAKVELRHPTGQPRDLWLYENDQPVIKIQPVDLVLNSNSPFTGIRFANSNQSEHQSC
jgi:putative transposase